MHIEVAEREYHVADRMERPVQIQMVGHPLVVRVEEGDPVVIRHLNAEVPRRARPPVFRPDITNLFRVLFVIISVPSVDPSSTTMTSSPGDTALRAESIARGNR